MTERKKANTGKLVELAIRSTGSPRAAFDLAHRARRLLERAAETASRDRWDRLDPTQDSISDPHAKFAGACAMEAINYPVIGEAAVYAALLDAVDAAHAASEILYAQYLDTQRTEKPVPIEGVNRIGAPLAPGCSRRFCAGSGDDEISS